MCLTCTLFCCPPTEHSHRGLGHTSWFIGPMKQQPGPAMGRRGTLLCCLLVLLSISISNAQNLDPVGEERRVFNLLCSAPGQSGRFTTTIVSTGTGRTSATVSTSSSTDGGATTTQTATVTSEGGQTTLEVAGVPFVVQVSGLELQMR